MNCICGAKWCQIRDVCSLVGRSEPNGHRRYGEQSVRRSVRPQEWGILAESLGASAHEALLRGDVRYYPFDETSGWVTR